jgi:hypothetical protein
MRPLFLVKLVFALRGIKKFPIVGSIDLLPICHSSNGLISLSFRHFIFSLIDLIFSESLSNIDFLKLSKTIITEVKLSLALRPRQFRIIKSVHLPACSWISCVGIDRADQTE